MNRGRSNQEIGHDALLRRLARMPLDRVIPFATILPQPCGSVLCSTSQFDEWTFLMLSGRCELRSQDPGDSADPARVFSKGEFFGGHTRPSAGAGGTVVATEDSVLLRIRTDEAIRMVAEAGTPVPAATVFKPETRPLISIPTAPAEGRIITLAFLSRSYSSQTLERSLATALHTESGGSVALVRIVRDQDSFRGRTVAAGCRLDARKTIVEDGVHLVSLPHSSGALDDGGSLRESLSNLRRRFDFVLLSLPTSEVSDPWLFNCVAPAETAYLFLGSRPEDSQQLGDILRDLRPRLNSHIPVKLKPVLCRAEGESALGVQAQVELAGAQLHASIRDCPAWGNVPEAGGRSSSTRLFKTDVRWLAREMGDCLVGLALSSGGVKGLAHVGVFQVLEENGIEVDIVAGASMGAYVGALWAYGCDAAQLQVLAMEMQARGAAWRLIDPVFPPRQGFLHGYAVKRRLQRTIGEVDFLDLAHPLRVVAANLDTLERVVFSSGEVATAVHASVAVPGICVPVHIGHNAYMDGGIVDPLPTDVLAEMGIHRILAVNTIPKPLLIRRRLKAEQKLSHQTEHRTHKLSHTFKPIKEHLNYFAHGNILDIFMHSIHGAQIRVAEASCRLAGVVLRPKLHDTRWLDFHTTSRCIAAGREAAERHLEEIRALARRKGAFHDRTKLPKSMAAII